MAVKARKPIPVTPDTALLRARAFKPTAAALVIIDENGRAVTMWHAGNHNPLILVGAAERLVSEMAWASASGARHMIVVKPKPIQKPRRKAKRK